MSKESAVALLVIEAAKKSYETLRIDRIDRNIWDEVCSDESIQHDVIRNYKRQSRSFFRSSGRVPSRDDFDNLRKEYRSSLDDLIRIPAVRSLFLCYQAEVEMFDDVCGYISESIEETVWEKIIDELKLKTEGR